METAKSSDFGSILGYYRQMETGRWRQNLEEATVSDLFLEQTQEWNEPLISHHFTARDRQATMAIPVIVAQGGDRRIWYYGKIGQYTVRLAYRLYMVKMVDQSHHFVPGEWRKLWNLQLPPNQKHLF